jgi:hypothetical protein
LTRENYATLTNRRSLGKDFIYIEAIQSNNKEILGIYSDIYADSEGLVYTDSRCKKYMEEAMENFDLNMVFFNNLDRKKFNQELNRFVKKTKFNYINDLNDCSCSGYYVMVLDDYSQLYVGTAKNIKDRIRQHWNGGKMRLDRLVCGSITSSKLSVDSFRSLDTTRILVYKTNKTYESEDKFIRCFSDDFICNRACGGMLLDADPFSFDMIDRYKFRALERFTNL